jgi:CMP/dCMP kinase
MTAVTVSRQFGSGGEEVAARVAEHLGWCYFDKSVMVMVARERGLSEAEVVDFSEDCYRGRTIVDALLGRSTPVGKATVWDINARGDEVAVANVLLNQQAAVVAVSGAIRRLAERGSVVVVGRGGQAILRGRPGVLHVRVVADLEDRVLRVMERTGLPRDGARSLMRERDRATAQYLRRFHEVDWQDPALYHLILNTSLLDVDAVADIVVAAARRLETASVVR